MRFHFAAILFAGLVLLSLSPAFSQKDESLKGFIVIKSDTVNGFFQIRNFDNTPPSITFRRSEADAFQIYRAKDISSFSIFGIVFRSYQTTIDLSSTKLYDIMNERNVKIAVDTTIFLRIRLQSSMITLYEHRINDQSHYFLQKEFNIPEELIKKCSYADSKISCQNNYWKTLRVYLNDCPSITDTDIKNTKLASNDLQRLLSKYVTCKSGKVNEAATSSNNKVHSLVTSFYVAPGLTSLSFNGPTILATARFEGLPDAKFGPTFSIQAGISFDDISKLNQNIVLGADVGIRYFNAKSDQTFADKSNGGVDHMTYSISPTYVKISPSLRYVFVRSAIHPYIRLGASLNYAINFSSSNELTQTKNSAIPHRESVALTPDEFSKIEYSYFLGAGVSKSKFSFEIRGEQGSGVLQSFSSYTSDSITTSLYIIYRLSKI